jgi:ankyrin repeat domain-containing protein 50
MTSTPASLIQTQFMLAAEASDSHRLESLFRESREHLRSDFINAALLLASKNGHLSAVQFLVDTAGSSTAFTDADGVTPLLWAQRHNHGDVVNYFKSLLGAEFKRNGRRVISATAKNQFVRAARVGALDSLQTLFHQHGCSIVEAVDEHGRSALHAACANGHLEIVRYLLTMTGAKLEAASNDGFTPLHFACSNGCLEVVEYLVETAGANVEAASKSNSTPIHGATKMGHLMVVKYLVGVAGANVEAAADNGVNPLHIACSNGHLAVVRYLVETANADVAAEEENGLTPLLIASIQGHLHALQYLLSVDIVEAKNKRGLTPLLVASQHGHLNIVQYSLSTVTDNVDARDTGGNTALHHACLGGQMPILQHLIEAGANVEASNKLGDQALHFACVHGHLELVVHLHAETCINVHAANELGQTALHNASANGHLEIVRYFVEVAGVSVHTQDKTGNTPAASAKNRIPESDISEQLESVVEYLESKRISQIFSLARQYPTLLLGAMRSMYGDPSVSTRTCNTSSPWFSAVDADGTRKRDPAC